MADVDVYCNSGTCACFYNVHVFGFYVCVCVGGGAMSTLSCCSGFQNAFLLSGNRKEMRLDMCQLGLTVKLLVF